METAAGQKMQLQRPENIEIYGIKNFKQSPPLYQRCKLYFFIYTPVHKYIIA